MSSREEQGVHRCGQARDRRSSSSTARTDATNAVVLGQADAMSADSPVTLVRDQAERRKARAAGEIFDSAPYGWPVKKGSPLAQSLQQALAAPDRDR